MQIFEHTTNINGNLTNYKILCSYKSNRAGFKHIANLFISCYELAETSIQYYNRTWESYTYQSCILQVIDLAKKHTENRIKELALKETGAKTMRSQAVKEAVQKAIEESQRLKEFAQLYEHFKNYQR